MLSALVILPVAVCISKMSEMVGRPMDQVVVAFSDALAPDVDLDA